MPFYERGPVRIHYQEVGSGFPLLLIPGGGLSSALSSWQTASPFDPMERYQDDFRCICADLRNANPGRSSGPLEIELTRRNILFRKFGGLKFLDSAHVKDMLAALRFAENPRDRIAGFSANHVVVAACQRY